MGSRHDVACDRSLMSTSAAAIERNVVENPSYPAGNRGARKRISGKASHHHDRRAHNVTRGVKHQWLRHRKVGATSGARFGSGHCALLDCFLMAMPFGNFDMIYCTR